MTISLQFQINAIIFKNHVCLEYLIFKCVSMSICKYKGFRKGLPNLEIQQCI